MIQIKTATAAKILKSKKDFLFFDVNKDNIVTNYVLTNDYKKYKKLYQYFRVVSTLKSIEYITIK
jgi:hypothetical protein